MQESWDALVRQYLAFNDIALLQQAQNVAPIHEIALVLNVAEQNPAVLCETAEAVLPILKNKVDILTIYLLITDCRVQLVEFYNRFPVEQQPIALQAGVDACLMAFEFAEALEYKPLMALYSKGRAIGFHNMRRFAEAYDAYKKAEGLYRELARKLPNVYLPYVARTLTGLGDVLSNLRELEIARKSCEKALAIHRELPHVYLPDVAMTLDNLGGVLYDLRELAAARTAYMEALRIRCKLARELPNVASFSDRIKNHSGSLRHELARELSDVAVTLNNLGNVLSASNELPKARSSYEEAKKIYGELEQVLSQVYRPHLAASLNNLGIVLRDLRELDTAHDYCKTALEIRRELAQADPTIYLPDVAGTLNNIGNVLRDRNDFDDARVAYEESLQIRRELVLWFGAAETLNNLGYLEAEENQEKARSLFEQCVYCCECGMVSLAEREHRDRFKYKIAPSFHWLIRYDVRRADANGLADGERLTRWLEPLRQIEAISGADEEYRPEDTPWREAADDLLKGSGALAEQFRDNKAVFFWVHATLDGVAFIVLTPGKCHAYLADDSFRQTLQETQEEMEGAFHQHKQIMKRWTQADSQLQEIMNEPAYLDTAGKHKAEQEKNAAEKELEAWERDTLPAVQVGGENAFALLPPNVQSLLAGNEYETLFISPCEHTISLPWELLRAPGSEPIGLHKLMCRVQGLAGLAAALNRKPDIEAGWNALLVGNPMQDLNNAEKMAKQLSIQFKAVIPAPNVIPLIGPDATYEALETALNQQRLGFWAFIGHGSPPGSQDGVATLVLANEGRFYPQTLARRTLPGTVLHFDCCVAGLTLGRGGGRFDGLPAAAMQAGASCVLSSAHPLLENAAHEFSNTLYTTLLDEKDKTVADALMKARQRMARDKDSRNPLLWATTVLWGNPWVKLPNCRP